MEAGPGFGPETDLENASSTETEAALDEAVEESAVAEHLPDEFVQEVRETADMHEAWAAQKTGKVMQSHSWLWGKNSPLTLNQAQGVVGKAIGIMATLMIGVVVLGKIDSFTLDLSGNWSETANDVSNQSQQTFDFLNLVPFLLVALFVLGIMATRM
jgi:hypothetical protein